MLALADGRLLQELPLPAPPVQDGLAIADGLVVLSLWDGSLVAFR